MDFKNLSNEALAKLAAGEPLEVAKLSEQDLGEIQKLQPKVPETTVTEQKPSTTLADAGVGLGQGLTMSFGDEIGAALQTGADKTQAALHTLAPGLVGESPTQAAQRLEKEGFTGDIGPRTAGEMYRKAREENRKIIEQAKSDSPIAYGASELAGGIISGIATAPLAPELVAGSTAKGVLPAASRIAAGAVNAAPLGAAYGLGESTADLTSGKMEDIKTAAKETGRGAITGSLVGATVSAVPEAYRAGKELASNIPVPKYLKKLKYNYDLGTNKINPADPEAQVGSLLKPESLDNPLAGQDTDAARQVVDLYKDMDLKLGKEVGNTAKQATLEGKTISLIEPGNVGQDGLPVDPVVKSLEKLKSLAAKDPILAETPQYERILEAIQKATKASMTPEEAHMLKMELGAMGAKISDTQPLIAKQAFEAASGLRSKIATAVPEYGMATTRQYEFRQMLPETLLSKGNPVDLTGIRVSDVANYENKLLNNTKNIIKGVDEAGNPSSSAKESMTNMLRGLRAFSEAEKRRVPGATIFDEFKVQPEDIEKHLKESAFRSSALKEFNEPLAKGTGGSLGEVKRIADVGVKKAANLAGQAKAALGGKANPVLDAGKMLYNASDSELTSVAQQLGQDPTGKKLGESLNKAIKENNVYAKNAAIFAIMQNPNLRKLIKEKPPGE